jgi:RsiW-degrading membrane proteinase PrsW (M82 family)
MSVAIALLPVVVFLAALFVMDTFRLVRPSAIAWAVAYGAVAAGAANIVNRSALDAGWSPDVVTRYLAPMVEEALKSAFVVALIATGRVGFLVDAVVHGFAVGTGFALVENVSYLRTLPDAGMMTWLVRGLGTAMLHGSTTAIFAMTAKALSDRRQVALAFVPAFLGAVVIHSAFNHRLLPTSSQALLLLILLPLLVVAVFARSERVTREWIGAGLDLDLELLNLVSSETFAVTRFGRYLQELRTRMPGPVVADMFCLLRLELELSVQAKGLLIAREAGLDLPPHPDLEAALRERSYLHQSIGRTGRLALKPLQVTSRTDRWHRHLLRSRSSGAAR